MQQFNYKTVYIFLLSLFGAIVLLSLMGKINSSIATNYSILGVISCLVAWIIDIQIIHYADEIRSRILYRPDLDDHVIHERLGKRIWLLWGLFGFLFISLIVSLI